MKHVAVVGSVNADLVTTTRRLPVGGETVHASGFAIHPGGKGANQAVALGRLGQPVEFIGLLGRDIFNPMLRRSLADAGVGLTALGEVDGPSGVASITVVPGGENQILIVAGANAHVTPAYVEAQRSVLEGAALILTQMETPYETLVYLADFAQRHRIPLVVDPAPAAPIGREVLEKVSWLTPNLTEAAVLTNSSAQADLAPHRLLDRLRGLGSENVLLKLGEAGLLASPAGEDAIRMASHQVAVVDTTAAGDALNAGFAAGLARGMHLHAALTLANAVAALSVTKAGAQPSLPTGAEVERFMTDRKIEVETVAFE